IGLDIAGVVPAGDRSPEFLQSMKEGFDKMLDGAFHDARKAYDQAGTIAKQRGSAFDEWVALHGEEDAFLAMNWEKKESQSLRDDYQRRRTALEQAPKVKEWVEEARNRRDRVTQKTIENFIERERRHLASGWSRSFSIYPHDYWTMFRDLE